MMTKYCDSCKECFPTSFTRYGETAEGKIRCFTCCAEEDKAQLDRLHMDHTGKICMYLTHRPFPMHNDRGAQKWIMGTAVAGTITKPWKVRFSSIVLCLPLQSQPEK